MPILAQLHKSKIQNLLIENLNAAKVCVEIQGDVHSQCLIHELGNGNIEKALECAVKLISLGPGLTPLGDDFLVGLFTIINLPIKPRSFATLFPPQIFNIIFLL